ncbi:hypothetical protein F5B20DRAFT_561525 [Whalleya microplaca]|nr:hypothetical protein F5B20DRAFT_561525 [Whalleya microplaca]
MLALLWKLLAVYNGMHQELSYAKLRDESFAEVKTPGFTDEKNTPTLAAVGVRSSVSDMLTWAKALLEAQVSRSTPAGNPIRELSAIWSPQSEVEPGVNYCFGWYRGHLPGAGFGAIGHNHRVREQNPDEYNKRYVLGRESGALPFIGHSGNCSGFASSMYVFPETSSAVVAMANGMDLGDAADVAVKIFTQALFDLKPQVDLLELAQKEAQLHQKWFEDILVEWCEDRDITQKEAGLQDYVGDYEGFGIRINVFLREETGRLAFTLNSVPQSLCDLEYYRKDNFDVYSFLPLNRDAWLTRAMFDWDYYAVGLFYFARNKKQKVYGLSWMYEVTEEMGWFRRSTTERNGEPPSGPP